MIREGVTFFEQAFQDYKLKLDKRMRKFKTTSSVVGKLQNNARVSWGPSSSQYAKHLGQNESNEDGPFYKRRYSGITECLEDNYLSAKDRKYAIDQGYLRKNHYVNPLTKSFNKNQLYFYAKGMGLPVTRKTYKVDLCKSIIDHYDKK